MSREFPIGRWERSVAGGKTAFKIGGKVLRYLTEKPFLPEEEKRQAKELLDRESAVILFKGLSLLKGTALKIGQLLSLELDILPQEVRTELEKTCNEVPPINRAMVRRIIINNLGRAPEEAFRSFESAAFAAASLGQVHRAVSLTGEAMAVKIQYPGIEATIANDVAMIKAVLKPLPEYDLLLPVLEEIRTRLLEETDYEGEARNIGFFGDRLEIPGVRVPRVFHEYSTPAIIGLSFMEGLPLNEWMKQNPTQDERDRVAQTLYDIFLSGLYELHAIHADPNPGNFIVGKDLTVSLVDFGCVKYFDEKFVDLCRRLPLVAVKGNIKEHMDLLAAFDIGSSQTDPEWIRQKADLTYEMGRWFGKLYEEERFDFGAHRSFVQEGRQLMQKSFTFRKGIKAINTNFVFLNRTRYGLVRLFQLMEARVRIRNRYEYDEA
jgi:predicted unusual protein kinase regulating ubiquinone biosynthesis (AarF/ABC1/UbiB family)